MGGETVLGSIFWSVTLLLSCKGFNYKRGGYAAQGKREQARAAFRSAAEDLRNTLGPDHPDTQQRTAGWQKQRPLPRACPRSVAPYVNAKKS
jgi:hypothetical protein